MAIIKFVYFIQLFVKSDADQTHDYSCWAVQNIFVLFRYSRKIEG